MLNNKITSENTGKNRISEEQKVKWNFNCFDIVYCIWNIFKIGKTINSNMYYTYFFCSSIYIFGLKKGELFSLRVSSTFK